MECHHIKKRRVPHLRHVTPNGVPLCRYHHRQAEYRETRQRIEYLSRREHYGVAGHYGAETIPGVSLGD